MVVDEMYFTSFTGLDLSGLGYEGVTCIKIISSTTVLVSLDRIA